MFNASGCVDVLTHLYLCREGLDFSFVEPSELVTCVDEILQASSAGNETSSDLFLNNITSVSSGGSDTQQQPSTALTSEEERVLYQLLRQVVALSGSTFLTTTTMVTHNDVITNSLQRLEERQRLESQMEALLVVPLVQQNLNASSQCLQAIDDLIVENASQATAADCLAASDADADSNYVLSTR